MASGDEVMIFWDLNTTPLPLDYDAKSLINNINNSLQWVRRHGHVYHVGDIRYMIGDWREMSKKMSGEQFKAIQEDGFTPVERFERSFMCSGPTEKGYLDHEIPNTSIFEKPQNSDPNMALIDELADQLKQGKPRNILFITGDVNFKGIMDLLRNSNKNYTVFLGHPKDADPKLRKGSNYAWLWETEMLKGVRASHYNI